jgi:fucose permease
MPDPTTAAAGALTRPQLVAWRNSIFLVFALTGITISTWVARIPAVRDALNIELDQVGVLIAGMAIGSILGLILSSHIVARLGARRTMAWFLLVLAAGITIVGIGATVGPVFAVTFAGLVILGFAMGITDVAMNVSGAVNERALERSIMPIFHAFFSIGAMIGAGAGALLELAQVPILTHLGGVAVIIVVGMLVAVRFIQSENILDEDASATTAENTEGTWRSRLGIWRDPRTLMIGLLVLTAAFAEGTASDWLALAMVDGHGVNNATGALVFGVFVTAMTVGRLGGVVLLDRFGRVPVLRASFVLAAAGLLLIIFVPNPIVATIGAIAWGLGSALGFPIGMSAAADDPKTAAARVSAVATIGYFAFLVGPPLIGFLGQQVGLLNALMVALVLCVVGAIVSSAAREPTSKSPMSDDTMVDPINAPTRF